MIVVAAVPHPAKAEPEQQAHGEGRREQLLDANGAAEQGLEARSQREAEPSEEHGPERGSSSIQQEEPQRGVSGRSEDHGGHRAQTVEEAEPEHERGAAAGEAALGFVRVLPEPRPPSDERAPGSLPHVEPELVTGDTAEKGSEHDERQREQSAMREGASRDQHDLALEKRAHGDGRVSPAQDERLKHRATTLTTTTGKARAHAPLRDASPRVFSPPLRPRARETRECSFRRRGTAPGREPGERPTLG